MKPEFNQLYRDSRHENSVLFAFQRSTNRRKPYTLIRETEVHHQVGGFYRRSEPRRFKEFAPFTPDGLDSNPMTAEDAEKLIAHWHLVPVPIGRSNVEAYTLLLAEAEKHNLPVNYKTDLTHHDRVDLMLPNATRHFLWVLRTSGTHLFQLDRVFDSEGNRPIDLVEAGARFGDTIIRWYEYDNGVLKHITLDQARQLAREALEAYRSSKRQAADHCAA